MFSRVCPAEGGGGGGGCQLSQFLLGAGNVVERLEVGANVSQLEVRGYITLI